MNKLKQKKLCGFSLVELMAALAVVSTLVALALPRYRLFITSARQAEAHANLGIIASLQQTYQLASGSHYSTSFKVGSGNGDGGCGSANNQLGNELGFRVVDCAKLRYTYSPISGVGDAEHDEDDPRGSIYPNCHASSYKDKWEINAQRKLTQTPGMNIIEACHD